MTSNQIALVQSSFAKIMPIADDAAALFYSRLFELEPETRTLFKGDMVEQGSKLMAMLRTLVNTLDQPHVLLPVARRLARRHVAYGALDAHYPIVGAALLDTLARGLGAEFTPEVREAWVAAYGALAGAMIDAVAEPHAA